ncbi:hypothetical protein Ancab_030273 [Ancistrocladus abbreviatus]
MCRTNAAGYKIPRGSSAEADSHAPRLPPDFSVSTLGCHTQAVLADEFPHLDIINDLLEDEHVSRGVNNGPNLLNRPSALAPDMGTPGEMASSASSCRFERSRSHNDDGFQEGYVCGTHIDPLSKYIPQANLMPYGNGSIDGLVQKERQVAGPDISSLSMRKSGTDGYPYSIHDYLNQACRINGYTMFRPSNGH